jgi:putative FmdB family regulatory protein
MPLYEYKCEKCDKVFEGFSTRSRSCSEDPGEPCPECKEQGKRVEISTTSEPVFKGKGFYATDYKGKHT